MKQQQTIRAMVVGAISTVALAGLAAPAAASHGLSEDQAIAESGVVVAADFPTAWDEDIGQNHVEAFIKAAKKVKPCKSYLAAQKLVHASPIAPSSDYRSGTAVASNTVAMLASQTAADAVVDAYKNVSTAKCLAQVLPTVAKADIAQDGKVSSVKTVRVQPVTPTVAGAESTAGYRLLVDAKLGSKTQRLYVDSWMVRVGRSINTFDFERTGSTFDSAVASSSANASTARVAAGVASVLAAGESASLAEFLPTVDGYTYEQPTEEANQGVVELVTAAQDVLSGASRHSVISPDGQAIGVLTLLEYRPEVASLPGFRAGSLEADAQGIAEAAGGTPSQLQIGGEPAWVVSAPDGSVTLFDCGNVEVWFGSPSQVDQAATATFAAAFLATCR
jgi:hypothetical protein